MMHSDKHEIIQTSKISNSLQNKTNLQDCNQLFLLYRGYCIKRKKRTIEETNYEELLLRTKIIYFKKKVFIGRESFL